jgi:hypothetical protein
MIRAGVRLWAEIVPPEVLAANLTTVVAAMLGIAVIDQRDTKGNSPTMR